MRAMKLYGPHDLRLVEAPMPTPGRDEALLRVRCVTVCHSDIHYYRDGRIGDTVSSEPLTLGHEFCAEVVHVPAGEEGLREGDLVAVEPALSCGVCRYCREGNPNLCMRLQFVGTPPMDGGLQEYLAYKPEFLFPLPRAFSADDGALLEPLGVAIHGWDLAKLRIAETVAILGCGPIGLLLIQLARIGGASKILAVEPLAYRRELAAELGAIALDPQDDLTRRAQEHTGGYGVDVAIEVAGSVPAQEQAAQMVKRGGTMVLIGIPPEDQLVMTHHLVRRKGLTIKVARRMKLTYPRAITLVERGMVHLDALITHRFPLAQADQAFRLVVDYGDNVVKAAIYPHE
jgi:L-iditol 2-dehydrogenase